MLKKINKAISQRVADGCVKSEFNSIEINGGVVKVFKLYFPIQKDGRFFYFIATVTGEIVNDSISFTEVLICSSSPDYKNGYSLNNHYKSQVDFAPLYQEVKFTVKEMQLYRKM